MVLRTLAAKGTIESLAGTCNSVVKFFGHSMYNFHTQPKGVLLMSEEAVKAAEAPAETPADSAEDIHYQAVEKDGTVTAIWEMQGQKHLRTIDPRSNEGKQILALFETAG